jgi:tRNA-binding protein
VSAEATAGDEGPCEPRLPEVDAERFFGVDMRVGTVVECAVLAEARVPAFRIRIDLGPLGHVRSSARLTDHYAPEDLVGTQVVVVANLPSRQVGPVRSEVLVLGAYERGSRRVVLLRPERPCRNGDRIG